MASVPTATPMPMPAFMPVPRGEGGLRPGGGVSAEVGVGVDVLREMGKEDEGVVGADVLGKAGRGDERDVVGKMFDKPLVIGAIW